MGNLKMLIHSNLVSSVTSWKRNIFIRFQFYRFYMNLYKFALA